MLEAYYIVLGLTFVAALWLNAGALAHLCALLAWWGVSWLLDRAGAADLKLFVDFFAFHCLLILTIGNITRGLTSKAEHACTALAFAQVLLSATAYGSSYILALFHLPYETFNVLTVTYGWSLNLAFWACVAVFLGGSTFVSDLLIPFVAFAALACAIPGFLLLRKHTAKPLLSESAKHEIEALLARPIAYYGAPDLERRAVTQRDDPLNEEASKDKLIRLEERLSSTADQLSRIERMIESVQRENAAALKELAQAFNKAFDKAAAEYVTKAEFAPVKTAVFAVIGLMGAAVIGALLAQVIIQ